MMSDWAALGVDFKAAVNKVQLWIEVEGDGESDGSPARRPETASKK